MLAKCYSGAVNGVDARTVEIEVCSTLGSNNFALVGLPDKADKEAKNGIPAALNSRGLGSTKECDVTVKLAPADDKRKGIGAAVKMSLRPAHGAWVESVAVGYLRRRGFEIVDRSTHPVEKDRSLMIDIVAWDRKKDEMVFVEVNQQANPSPYSRRLRSVDRQKRMNLRRACNAWRRVNKWHGDFRFDVIEIYGIPEGGQPVIDHIDDVQLFARKERFAKWR